MLDHRQAETYVIQKGDSLSKIAQRYDLSTKELCELNGIKNPNVVRVGQKLILPPYAKKQSKRRVLLGSPRRPETAKQSRCFLRFLHARIGGGEYVVQSGDHWPIWPALRPSSTTRARSPPSD